VEYLGHIIRAEGVATDPAKIQAIQNWPQSKFVTQLRSFLGLTCYYIRFVQHYGLICRPLHDLLKKESFHWTFNHDKTFSTLKRSMANAPVLILPNFYLPFTLEVDAFGTAIGAILMQQGRPIAYLTQALGPKTAAQSTYHKEALAILQALKNGGTTSLAVT
jgi:hypothetical protein